MLKLIREQVISNRVIVLHCNRVCFSLSNRVLKKKNVVKDKLETFVLNKEEITDKSVYMAENMKRVLRRVKKKHASNVNNVQKSKVMEILSDEYNSLSIGQLLSYEEKAKNLRIEQGEYKKTVQNASPEDKDKMLSDVLEKQEKQLMSKTWKIYGKPTFKNISVLSQVTLTEEDLLDSPESEGGHNRFKKRRKLEQKWNSLPADEKERLKAQCEEIRKQLKSSYVKELSTWILSLVDYNEVDEILPILSVKEVKMILDHLVGFTPKKARTARQLFMASDLGKTLGVTLSNVVGLYNSLDENKIEKFTRLAQEERVRSAQEKELWEKSIDEKGLQKLVEIWKKLCRMNGKEISVYS